MYGTLFISCFLVNDYYGQYKKLIVLVKFLLCMEVHIVKQIEIE